MDALRCGGCDFPGARSVRGTPAGIGARRSRPAGRGTASRAVARTGRSDGSSGGAGQAPCGGAVVRCCGALPGRVRPMGRVRARAGARAVVRDRNPARVAPGECEGCRGTPGRAGRPWVCAWSGWRRAPTERGPGRRSPPWPAADRAWWERPPANRGARESAENNRYCWEQPLLLCASAAGHGHRRVRPLTRPATAAPWRERRPAATNRHRQQRHRQQPKQPATASRQQPPPTPGRRRQPARRASGACGRSWRSGPGSASGGPGRPSRPAPRPPAPPTPRPRRRSAAS